ncbi:MAG: hypothetical protein HKN11_13555 [Rhizobiales bacterium]|nr:hypothetical protein [Hyphomicrobiales bacterium]
MSSTTELSPFNERDFRAIEAAVLETEKGRWFLSEFGRRNRVADTQTLLTALGQLERNLTSQVSSGVQHHPDIAALSGAIEATRTDIGAIRNDMLKDHAEIPPGKPVFSHLSENAHQISVDLITTAEALQGSVKTLREGTDGATHAETIDGHVHKLFDGGWRQDVLAQRISKAMGLLEHLDQNLKAHAGSSAIPAVSTAAQEAARSLPTSLSQDNLKFFDGDNDMFATADKPRPAEPARHHLKVLENKPRETPSSETVINQAAYDEARQDKANAITPPPSSPADEPVVQDSAQQAAEAKQEPVAVIDEKPIEPNIVVIRRGKGQPAAEPDDSASKDTSTDAANTTDNDRSNGAPAEASTGALAQAPTVAPAEASNDAATKASNDASTGATADTAPAKDATGDIASDKAAAHSSTKVSRVTSSLFKAKPEEDVWDKVTETASGLSAGAADEPTVDTKPADTQPAASPKQTVADQPVSVSKDNHEKAIVKETPAAKNDQPPRSDGAKAELADMDLEAPKTPATSTAHSADDALSAFADIAAAPAAPAPSKPVIPASEANPGAVKAEGGGSKEDKDRIVVIRRSTSQDAEIPFADYLGVDSQTQTQDKAG